MRAEETQPAAPLPVGPEVDATPAQRPARTILPGRFVRLVPLDAEAHFEALYDNVHGPGREGLWAYFSAGPFHDRDSFHAFLAQAAASEDPLYSAVLDAVTGEALGYASYSRIEPQHRVLEVGFILFTPKLQHTPGGTEAMYLMARHAFEDLGYRRYEWKCNALNEASRRAAQRYGFTFEGIFRQHMIVKGRNRDTAWYAMLDRDWPARKAAFEHWLRPENFDHAGRQRLRLSVLNAGEIEGVPGLRRAGGDDLEPLTALQQAAYAPNRDILGVEPLPLLANYGEVLGQYEVWLAERPGGLAGALILDPWPDHLLIWSVATAPAVQGQGLGKDLLAAAEARARQLGLKTLKLYVGEKLTRNVRWYHRHGYAIDHIEELEDRRLVHMVRRLR
jgi:RimJ/RimL family protein N-acetyltransferase